MEALDRRRMTYEEYLAFERASETKHEYVNGEVFAMAGGTREHARLAARLIGQLERALEGKPCATFTSDVRVRVEATGRSTYPDVTVVCGKVEASTVDEDAITNPTVLVEVLSPSTEKDDRTDKWAHYRRLPSLREFVLVASEEHRVEVYRREERGWHYLELTTGTLELASIGAVIDLGALYRDPTAA
jgi:Uma2 family endonuclease